jgi:two-component system LytT family response regulator
MTALAMKPQPPLRVIIVDDEPLAREDIVQLLGGRADVDIVATCSNGHEAIEAVRRLRPDVLLLDIRMPGLDGFSVIAQLDRRELPYVVFVTAFDRFAIDAFRVRALDYLLKPVQPARLDEALDRAREQLARRSVEDWTHAVHAAAREQARELEAPTFLSELMVRVGTRDIILKVDEIDWIQAETYYARLHIRGRSYLYRERMHILEARLNPRHFARVHRSAIVNLDRVREIVHDSRGDHVVVLTTGARVKTSHQRWLEFREIMRQRTSRR